MSSTLLAIYLKGGDRIEEFSGTMADDGRIWLKESAGAAIS